MPRGQISANSPSDTVFAATAAQARRHLGVRVAILMLTIWSNGLIYDMGPRIFQHLLEVGRVQDDLPSGHPQPVDRFGKGSTNDVGSWLR